MRRFDLGLEQRPWVSSVETRTGPAPIFGSARVRRILHLVSGPKQNRLVGVDGLPGAVRRLRELAKIDLAETHVRFFGDVLIISTDRSSASFNWEARGQAWSPDAILLSSDLRRQSVSSGAVSVRAYGTDELALEDRLFRLTPGALSFRYLQFNQPIAIVELRAWLDGELVWEEKQALFLAFGMTLNMSRGTAVILDRLTALLDRSVPSNATQNTAERVRTVNQVTPAVESLHGAEPSRWRSNKSNAAAELFDAIPPEAEAGTYFPRGPEGRGLAFLRLAELISSAEESWLIDPFFDESGAEGLLSRISRSGYKLTILTSLLDTADQEQLRAKLATLANFGLLRGDCRVIRAVTSGQAQAFHDRFLIVRRKGNIPRGYMLSNSLSGLARYYSLVVQELKTGTTAAVLREAESILSQTSGQQLSLEHLWPPLPIPRVQAAADKWPHEGAILLLEKLVPRAFAETREKWIARAEQKGWIRRNDGDVKWLLPPGCDQSSLLDRLRPQPAAFLKRFRFLWRSEHPTGVGALVLAIGEANARGWKLDSAAVSRRFERADIELFARYLRQDVPEYADDRSRHAAQNLRTLLDGPSDAVSPIDVVDSAYFLLADKRITMDVHQYWGRQFVYDVMLRIDAQSAIREAYSLRDITFLVALARPFGGPHAGIDESIARALLVCESLFLQSAGAHWITQSALDGGFHYRMKPPDDVDAAVRRLRAGGASEALVVLMNFVWGQHAAPGQTQKLAQRVVDGLAETDWTELRRALAGVSTHFAVSTLEALEGAGCVHEVRDLLSDTAQKWMSENGELLLPEQSQNEIMAAMARGARFLGTAKGSTGADIVAELMGLEDLAARAAPLSPVRRSVASDVAASFALALIWQGHALEPSGRISDARWRGRVGDAMTDHRTSTRLRRWLESLL